MTGLTTKSVLFLVPYPLEVAPSQRFRFEQYFRHFPQQLLKYRVQSFINSQKSSIVFKPGHYFTSIWLILAGSIRRLMILASAKKYDYIFIHREAAPVGPPVIEWVLTRLLGCKVIYDYDDALWITDRVDEPWWLRLIKWRSKIASICRWSYKVSCGNSYLQQFALRVNPSAFVIPTTIDADEMRPAVRNGSSEITIGWTGSYSTLKYLDGLIPVLTEVAEKFRQVRFVIIADVDPMLKVDRMKFVPWNAASEIKDLQQLNIGLMPLPDDEWTRGKCGFKALQYMAVGIPAVVSPVGVNTDIVGHGVNGFHASTSAEWIESISRLIEDPELRRKMGEEGRRKVVARYSIESNCSAFFSLFE